MLVALIGCTAKKKAYPCSAVELYSASPIFRLEIECAHALRAGVMFILSAKHGLVLPSQVVAPYNFSLGMMSLMERKAWGVGVLKELGRRCDLARDQVIMMAGGEYVRLLEAGLPNATYPLRGVSLFKRVARLRTMLVAARSAT